MWQNAHDAYLESRIMSAGPIELVRLLCHGAIGAVEDARAHLASGDIASRARSITKANNILVELASSLDHERGGEISANLVRLYDYMLRRLTEANFQQIDAPLVEVLGLLGTLSEAWDGLPVQQPVVQQPVAPAPSYPNTWNQPVIQEPVSSYASQSWSL
jgi:flagellar protein FliS